MAGARLDSVARYICEHGKWAVTNLHLQKVLYLSQMIYMGRYRGDKMVDARFEAWDYGPVEPSLYKRVRMFGSGPIENVFFDALPFKEDSPRKLFLDEICRDILPISAGELVEITHWKGGAWAKHYEPGVRGIRIPDEDIVREYGDRISDGNLIENNEF